MRYYRVGKRLSNGMGAGTELINHEGMLLYDGKFICMQHSQNAKDALCVGNDDGKGEYRAKLIGDIQDMIVQHEKENIDCHYDKINGLFDDRVAMRYAADVTKDGGSWIWNDKYYEAPIEDLEYIYGMIKEVQSGYRCKTTVAA